ncbi:MBL fold metallo-hydrolase [Vibrio hangzhouensis]|uniref:Glyoxylase, beta-lactamase superfamily II n=1 Tax=Vibrio hangzhouensis TaxID=462991 RepID=A0A1H6C5R3_9VIBR|nr:MBL fold metallo-hydrolase [Vibrio hangzhouensis]SEG68233.1 Glyoxylase, beta-lactamase superfamily II [Vibrio hangzhouensis]
MKIHQIQGYIQQIYLVEYPDKLLLLDGASRADVGTILRFISDELSRPITDLKAIIVTHMHPDHAGAAHRLRKLTGAHIVSSEKEEAWYSGLDGFLMHLTDLMLAWWMAARMGRPRKNLWYKKRLIVDYQVKEGDSVPLFSDWRILDTPGHTDRDISVYNHMASVVYVADLMVEVKQQLIAPFPIFHPNQYRASIEKIHQLGAQQVLLAHRGPVTFDAQSKQHILDTAPMRPLTHWRVTKIKLKGIFRSCFYSR